MTLTSQIVLLLFTQKIETDVIISSSLSKNHKTCHLKKWMHQNHLNQHPFHLFHYLLIYIHQLWCYHNLLFHTPIFTHHIFHFCFHFYHLHLTPSRQGKCHLCIQPLFPRILFHSCHHLYHLHLPPSRKGECHMFIQPIFPLQFFTLVIFLSLTSSSISIGEVSSGHSASFYSSYFSLRSSFIYFTPSSI